MSQSEPVRVSIMGKEYQIACPPEERADLFASASLIDERMRELRDGGRIVGAERIAVMVALNLAHEMLECRQQKAGADTSGSSERLVALADRIEKSLGSSR
ncbi:MULTISPECIES: cell division protein ZapA [Thioalkalivibrio]|uniref:Cell division protein ZapA n=1 Tax=Thioalkalivibrio versutus TaxID=106634 RepID=A0A0G3G389_9GAMM|nr:MULTISPECIES: cell division protein ZapA [Thioalkalivibrio]AKJ95668.1 Z-ring-associated protein ZapA [Thioalkalivibrio versutus]OOC50192.1 cell division protein ZapA [Thioalkalivibrio versutus]